MILWNESGRSKEMKVNGPEIEQWPVARDENGWSKEKFKKLR